MNKLDQILKNFGDSNKDIYSIITFGSFFHLDSEKCSDSFTDLDLILFTNDVKKYGNQNKTDWLSSFPNPVLSVYVQKGGGMLLTRVMFSDFFCIDFIIMNKKLLLLSKRYIQLKKFKVFNFLFKKGGRIENYISANTNYLSSGYKIVYSCDKQLYPVIDEIAKNYRSKPEEFDEEAFKVNYNGFWQTCYKIYIRIKRDDMLYGVLVNDNILKRTIIEVLIWREHLKPVKNSAIFKGKNIQHWGGDYYSRIKNDLMFSLNTEEAYSTLLKNISFYKSISKEVSDWHLPDLENSIISLLKNEINNSPIQDKNDVI